MELIIEEQVVKNLQRTIIIMELLLTLGVFMNQKVIKPDPPWPLKAMIIVGIIIVSILTVERACFYFIRVFGIHDLNINHINNHETKLELTQEELPRTYYMTAEPTPMEINGYSVMLPYAYTMSVAQSHDTRLTDDKLPRVDISDPVELPELRIRWGCLSGSRPIDTAIFLLQVKFLGAKTWPELLTKVHSLQPKDLRRAFTAYDALLNYIGLKFKSVLTYGGTKRYYKTLNNGYITVEKMSGENEPKYVLSIIRLEGDKAYGSQIVIWETDDKDHPLAEVAYIASHIQTIMD